MEWHQLLGHLGAFLIVGSFLGLQLEKLCSKSMAYSLLNLIGAVLVLVSLYFHFNMPALVIESFWALVSGIGVFKAFGREPSYLKKRS